MPHTFRQAVPLATETITVAFLLRKAAENGPGSLTPLQINKLAFILHGWTLGLLDRPLFDNRSRQIQAWLYGPVVVGIYHLLKPFGNAQVSVDRVKVRWESSNDHRQSYGDVLSETATRFMQVNQESANHLDWVYEIYSDFGGGQLMNLTSETGGPWDQCRPRGLERFGLGQTQKHIPDTVIGPYFKDFVTKLLSETNSHL